MAEELIKKAPIENESMGTLKFEENFLSEDSPKIPPPESVYKISAEIDEIKPDRQEHILAEKHDWNKVVSLPVTWNKVAQVMSRVLNEGTEGKYKSVFSKTLDVISNIVEVTYAKIREGVIKVSDAWVRK